MLILFETSQIFCLFMLTVGFCYFLFLYIDIRLHITKAKKAVKEKEKRMKLFEDQLAATQVRTSDIILTLQ